MSFQDAQKCFAENIRLAGGAQVDPVAFNLNNGLRMIADQLHRDMSGLAHDIQTLRREVADLRGLLRR